MPLTDDRSELGRTTEGLAVWWLRVHGWSVLVRNGTIAGVEVDIVSRQRGVDALVEVKARRQLHAWLPRDLDYLLAPSQRRRLALAAVAWAATRRARRQLVRVDLLEITWLGPWPRIRRHEDILRSEV